MSVKDQLSFFVQKKLYIFKMYCVSPILLVPSQYYWCNLLRIPSSHPLQYISPCYILCSIFLHVSGKGLYPKSPLSVGHMCHAFSRRRDSFW